MANITEMTHEERIELAFTQRQLEELEQARSMPIVFDEDCPEITPEQAVKFRRVNPFRRANN
ncbi:hypothetical protein N510_002352 [Firmicutes bacterium ASF500]|nr:hypothetical protein N510_002352 [Firmicutes bacterium ASF500]